ncbi:hypothetical protein [Streptomyces violascens]|uniref:hypothetical protein n=1 Tax=Streptomyces violascens TaxID=67381 RepID=UPI00367EDC2A
MDIEQTSSRRSALSKVVAGGLGLVAVSAGSAVASPRRAAAGESLTIYATREGLTLPSLPTAGMGFSTQLKLTDDTGDSLGDGSASIMIVSVDRILSTPLVLGTVVLRLPRGELHLQIYCPFIAPGRTQTGAIIGGTGGYRSAVGEVTRTTPNNTDITLELAIDCVGTE